MKAGALVAVMAFAVVGDAASELRGPVRVTLDGVAGVRPGMSVASVSERWGIELRPDYPSIPGCGEAEIRQRTPIVGYVVFWPRRRFAGVFFRRGAQTGRDIRIGSTLSELRRAYGSLRSQPNRYVPGGREFFVRRRAAPHWELRIDVGSTGRVTQIAFGTHAAVQLDEGCS
jgi:hypothetical protein